MSKMKCLEDKVGNLEKACKEQTVRVEKAETTHMVDFKELLSEAKGLFQDSFYQLKRSCMDQNARLEQRKNASTQNQPSDQKLMQEASRTLQSSGNKCTDGRVNVRVSAPSDHKLADILSRRHEESLKGKKAPFEQANGDHLYDQLASVVMHLMAEGRISEARRLVEEKSLVAGVTQQS